MPNFVRQTVDISAGRMLQENTSIADPASEGSYAKLSEDSYASPMFPLRIFYYSVVDPIKNSNNAERTWKTWRPTDLLYH